MDFHLTPDEEEEVQSLHAIFSELDLLQVRQVYIQCQKDYRAAQQALADLLAKGERVPGLPISTQNSLAYADWVQAYDGASPHAPPDRAHAERLRSIGDGTVPGAAAGAGGLAALAFGPPPQGDEAQSGFPELPGLDVNSIADTLSQVGITVTDGITQLANSLTNWVADLASAFDATWGDDDGEERHGQHQHAKDEPAVGYGSGVGLSDRPYQRRLAVSKDAFQTQSQSRADGEATWQGDKAGDGWDDELEDETGDEFGKDD